MSRHPWQSTKLHLALIAMALMTFAYAKAGWTADQFSNYCMWITSAAGIFSTAAAAEKFSKPPHSDVPPVAG